MKRISKPSYEELESLIKEKESFLVVGATKKILKYCSELEEIIESEGMTCRIYTKGRSWLSGVAAFATFGGTIALQAAHNIATKNPDWKIGRDIVNNQIEVVFRNDYV